MAGSAPVNPQLPPDVSRILSEQSARIDKLERELADLRRSLGR
jgi:hypothetical protein